MTRFSDPTAAAGNTQNDLRLSAGLLFRLGGHTPLELPVNRSFAVSCLSDNQTVYVGSGDAAIVRAQLSGSGDATLSYTWTTNGGSVAGSGRRSDGPLPPHREPTLSACMWTMVEGLRAIALRCRVAQKVHQPPTMVCAADRSSVAAGQPVQVTATASDAEQHSLTYSWSASGGNVVGSGPSVKLDTTGLTTGRYTVTGRVANRRGGTADCSVDVDAQAPTPLELRLALHSITFPPPNPPLTNPPWVCFRVRKRS